MIREQLKVTNLKMKNKKMINILNLLKIQYWHMVCKYLLSKMFF